MRKYLKNLVLISTILVAILMFMGLARMKVVQSHSWELPEKVHILFMGASHIRHAIDDSRTESAINWASASERYMFTYIKLEHLLEENLQIDTVFLELGATDLWEDTDYKYHTANEQSHFVVTYWPFFTAENWKIYKEEKLQILRLMISSLFSVNELTQAGWWKKMGGYEGKTSEFDINKKNEIKNLISGSGHEVNYTYLHRIIKLCKKKRVKLYFIETPVYHLEQIYDLDYYHKAYKKNFSEVEFVDFSNLDIPNEYRADGSHLNKQGASYFTELIKDSLKIK